MNYVLFVKVRHGMIAAVRRNVSLDEAKAFYKNTPHGFYCNEQDFARFYK
jgi:hypothetical protein